MACWLRTGLSIRFRPVLSQGQSDYEGGSLPGGASGRNGPTVALDDFAADGQPHTGTFVLASAMQPLEEREDAVQVLFIEADAVVLDEDLHPAVIK